MASLILSVAGQAIGASFGTIDVLGLTLSGAQLGGAIGAFVGSEIDAALAPGQRVKGPRLSDISIQSSTEGAAIPRVFGRVRVAGQLIWATRFKETSKTASSGGKGFGGPKVTTTDYAYSISFAVGLCEGEASRIGRVWADGTLIDLSQFTTRFYPGSETQAEDTLIQEIEDADNTPAYRGLCYIVFEDMALAQFGNRIPQLQFEVIRAISDSDPDALENVLPGVALIPGAGEFVYAVDVVTADDGEGTTVPQNAHNASGVADWTASLDELQALAPALGAASLVVGWFGDDLRCGNTKIMPGVEIAKKKTYPETWSVDGVARADAHLVSQAGGVPAYGGTPSDASVVAAIQDLKARGLQVTLCPFLFLDIAAGNALGDPYSGAGTQPSYPWRGRITCDPAPGVSGSPDKTGAATAQVAAFFGAAAAGDFLVSGTDVTWTGSPAEWGWRRMVLHYANLCAAAGGVDRFLIGSELRSLNRVRDGAASYPAVAALKTLAADVRAIFAAAGQSVKLGYAADWSEYANHQTGDAPGALLFNLDPLWSDANIDFIGIDNYMKLADWRDGTAHLDYDSNGPTTAWDAAYLAANIRGGEDYDWYYASDSDRAAQLRTPITDGLGKPFVWRAKDLWGWWGNAHFDRPDGGESVSPTPWTAQSKPIVFCELGCPAVDKGANQPNVFVDPKSSESALPYFSNGERDDLIQRRFLEAHLKFWRDPANNPVSAVYGGSMVDTAAIHAWSWDARPYPFFPAYSNIWGDAADYTLGHWLNGRLGAVLLPDLVSALCGDAAAIDVTDVSGLVTGYAVTATMSARDALSPLAVAYQFDAVESEGAIRFVARGRPSAAALAETDLAVPDDGDPGFGFTLVRAEESGLPLASRVAYIDAEADYRTAIVEARRLSGSAARVAQSSLPVVLDQGQAIGIGERLLMDAWTMRETAQFALPPSHLALDVTDEVELTAAGRSHRLRLTAIGDAGARSIEAVATDPSLYEAIVGPSRAPSVAQSLTHTGRALAVFLDLPLLSAEQDEWDPLVAAFAAPWPGAVLVMRSATESNYALDTTLTLAAAMGETTADVFGGPAWRWDAVNAISLKLYDGALAGLDDLSVLGGANALAIQNADGAWEVVQFADAALTVPGEWTLSRLLRGQGGTEGAMGAASGARVVVLNTALRQLSIPREQYALPFNFLWGPQDKPVSDPAWQDAAEQFAGAGMRPYAPCQLRAVYASGGADLALDWIRRDRAPAADSWDQTEIPLSESAELYDVEILDGTGAVKRTLASLPSASTTYTAADIATDFPSGLPSPFRFTVYQVSSVVGRGPGKAGSFNLN
ncbi:MAG: baseplate multidomain protein megatron [Rhizomicrobium sp.]